jgi:hypothetical protein
MPSLSPYTLAASALVFCLALTAPGSAEVQLFDKKTNVARVLEHKLGPDQSRTWRAFARACCYFGAYAINTESDLGFFVQGFNSRKMAISAAEAGCAEFSRSEGANPKACRLYAFTVPAELDVKDAAAAGLGVPAREGFTKLYQKNQLKTGYGAFAMASGRGWGASWDWPTRAEAQATAIAYCEADVAQTVAEIGPKAKEWISKTGAGKCRVVHETAPQE